MQTGIFLVRILLFLNPVPVHHPDIQIDHGAEPGTTVGTLDFGKNI